MDIAPSLQRLPLGIKDSTNQPRIRTWLVFREKAKDAVLVDVGRKDVTRSVRRVVSVLLRDIYVVATNAI